jgi:RHS repeat-associated protein
LKTKFVFHKENVLVDADKDYTFVSRFTRGYEVVAADIAESGEDLDSNVKSKLNRHYYTVDEQGSTALITNGNQSIKNEYWYDAFGNVLDCKEEVHNRITYTGQQFDGITGQYYLRARFYNPVIGRFTQEDIYRGDGLNLYAYCGNNPVAYYDPSGYVVCESKKSAYKEYRKQGLTATEAWNKVKSEGVSNTESEIFYRTISDKEYAKLEKNNMLTKRETGASELKVTTESDYVLNDLSKRANQGKKYNQSVMFELEPGTRDGLVELGGTHVSAENRFPNLPPFKPGTGQVEVKLERNGVESFGLGTSEDGLNLFNNNIKSINVFDSTSNMWKEIFRK